ncbi:MAG: YHS domain-containing protein [Sedimentisphaerales bacterium]|nr:YHS domain-containing protein [Sedimentisphaerales bacterium]
MKTLKTIILMALLAVLVVGLTGCKKKSEPVGTTVGQEVVADVTEQKTCPIMDGNPIDKNIFVEYKGKKVYFCCAGCKEKFEADPGKYVSKLPQFK